MELFNNDNSENLEVSFLINSSLQANRLRSMQKLVDVFLCCDNHPPIPAHKIILASASPYFNAMFTDYFPEADEKKIYMYDIDNDCLTIIVDFIYTGSLRITVDNVEQLYITGEFLQIDSVMHKCAVFMIENSDADNCIDVLQLGRLHSDKFLIDGALNYIIKNLCKIIDTEAFLRTSPEELLSWLQRDRLRINSTNTIVRGIMRWVGDCPSERQVALKHLLPYIDANYLPRDLTMEIANVSKVEEKSFKHPNHSKIWHEDMFILDRTGNDPRLNRYNSKTHHTYLPPIPMASHGFSMCNYHSNIFVLGGSAKSIHKKSFYFSIEKEEWQPLSLLECERTLHRSVVVDEHIYSIGGQCITKGADTVEVMDLRTCQTWFAQPMLHERSSHAIATKDNIIYAFGGDNCRHCLSNAERYDKREGIWTKLPTMLVTRGYASATALGNSIYVCSNNDIMFERFDLRRNAWSVFPVNSFPECEFHDLFVLNGRLKILTSFGVSALDETEMWNLELSYPTEHKWEIATVPRLPWS